MKNINNLCLILLLVFACNKEGNLPGIAPSNTTHTQDWMSDLIEKYPNENFSLKDIAIPRAHDAGVYELNNCVGGNECNTQTQHLNMKDMLLSGIRVFDVRPTLKEGTYWTYHATACNSVGCEGDDLEGFLNQTNNFLNEHNELIILEMSHLCNTSYTDAGLLNLIANTLGENLYKEDNPITTNFVERPLNQLLQNGGKALVIFEGMDSNEEDRINGWFSEDFFSQTGAYANKHLFDEMIADQISKFNNFNENSDALFKLCYTLTLNSDLAVDCFLSPEESTSIRSLSEEARELLSPTLDNWKTNEMITKGKIPNIISIDFCNTIVTEQCIALSEFNLE